MDIAWHVLAAGAAFFLLFALFRPLEIAYPADAKQRFFRPNWWTDLCFLLGQYLLFNGAVLWVLGLLSPWIYAATPGLLRQWIGSLHGAVQLPLVILCGDILIYWGHRFQHHFDFLWRFHSIHHGAEHLDWLAAHREHPLDTVYTLLLVNLPIFALGFPIESLAHLAAFRGLWAVFIHANVRLPIGPLRALFGAPELHHWHHERDRESCNFGNVSPLTDLLFGTYRCPGHEPPAIGVGEPIPRTYLGQLWHPFRRRRHNWSGQNDEP